MYKVDFTEILVQNLKNRFHKLDLITYSTLNHLTPKSDIVKQNQL